MENKIAGIVECLAQVEGDMSLPKDIKQKIRNAIVALGDGREFKIRANKALRELDDVSDNPNLPSYLRPQIWNVISVLEGF